MTRRIIPLLAASFIAFPALAQQREESKAAGSAEMHRIMMSSAKASQSMKMSGDTDRDFLTMMRHHHQSGIKMAEAELRHGKSAEAKAMAQKIIDAQTKEIAEIDAQLAKQQPSGAGSSGKSGASNSK